MKWGTKWGRTPNGPRSFWGKLKQECVDNMHLADSAQGSKAALCDSIYIVIPAFGSQSLTTLTYPFVTPTQTLALRNPKFGDIKIVDSNMIKRRSKSGDLITFRDASWPVFKTFKITIEKIKDTDRALLKTFLRNSAGAQIGLLDHLNRQWQGVILTQDVDIIQVYRDTCGSEFSFEFMGY